MVYGCWFRVPAPKHDDMYCSAALMDGQASDALNSLGLPASEAKQIVMEHVELDNCASLNTASYVNVAFEPEERECAQIGMRINMADQIIYKHTSRLHKQATSLVANLWHAPSTFSLLSGAHHM